MMADMICTLFTTKPQLSWDVFAYSKQTRQSILYTEAEKIALFYFCNNCVKPRCRLIICGAQILT